MDNHYIPQRYLKGFQDNSNPNFVWAYEVQSKRIFNVNTTCIAFEKDLYSEEIERYLNESIEGPTIKVFDKLTRKEQIAKSDKILLAKYITVIYNRVPTGKVRALSKCPKMLDDAYNKVEIYLKLLKNVNPHSKIPNSALSSLYDVKKLLEEDPRQREEFLNNVWQQIFPPEKMSKSLSALIAMNWNFLFSDEEVFLTCDNPFFFFKEKGLGNTNSEFSFPISKNVSLVASWECKNDRIFRSARKNEIEQLNYRMLFNSQRHVFFSQKCDWIYDLRDNINYQLKKIC